MSLEELRRRYRIIDMMLTMHSALRDRNLRCALAIDILLLSFSLVLCTTVFIDSEILSILKINPRSAKVVFGISSVMIFFLSLLSLRIDWKQKAEKHNSASEALSRLKSEYRELIKLNAEPNPQSIQKLTQAYNLILSGLPKIPESKFNKLKALHVKKVKLSKMISMHPGSSVLLLRLRLWFAANLNIFKASMPPNSEE